jgi:hypothetical protein
MPMTLKLNFEAVEISGLVLAKVGNPSRDEPLQTSKTLFNVSDDDQTTLCPIFLKPFRNLIGQRFTHHSSLEKNEVNTSAANIFEDSDTLLAQGCEIAQRLYSKSSHPNIKSGDLCISLINNINMDGETKRAICILKSESMTPFLSISTRDGDLQLETEQGINPEKIDKGCLILEHLEKKGYYVLTFDRAGSESRFWVRDFLSVRPIPDSALLPKALPKTARPGMSTNPPKKRSLISKGKRTSASRNSKNKPSAPTPRSPASPKNVSASKKRKVSRWRRTSTSQQRMSRKLESS